MSMGQKIKAVRRSRGLTQKELGQKLGLPFQSIAQWERDARNPKFETLQKIAEALETPIETFVPAMGMGDSIGNRIKATRNSQEMTQTELAQRLNMKPQTVGQYERGEKNQNRLRSRDSPKHLT